MATVSTIITYTAASGENDDRVTSLTFGTDGAETAFASLTAAQVHQAIKLLDQAARLLADPASTPGSGLTTKTHSIRGTGFRGTNT